MLTVVKVSVAQGDVYARYLEGRTARSAAGDYYLRDGERVEARGRWVLGGLGAEAIGVEDVDVPVEADVFRSLMAVVNPATGGPLRRVGGNGDAVGAIDCTFSAPKSVSAVWALANPELRRGLEAAHERAVDAALGHALNVVPMVRRRVSRETVVRERPVEVVATSWRHTTARAVQGRPPTTSDSGAIAVRWRIGLRDDGLRLTPRLAVHARASPSDPSPGRGARACRG